MRNKWFCLVLAAVLLFSCCPAAQGVYTEMTFSEDVVSYVKLGEGFSEQAVKSGGSWFIGYGCLVNPADYPNGITEAGADALLRENMQKFADDINKRFLKKYGLTVTQGQFDAMIAMSYALGPAWLSPENRLPSYLINGIANYSDRQIASAFAAWCHVGGKVNTVALKRRIMETNMFLYDDYSLEHYGKDLGWSWVTLDANGGKNALSDVDVYKTGEPYGALPEADRVGWYFSGWEKADGTLLLPTDTVSGNLSLKARWSETPVAAPQPAEDAAPATDPVPEPDPTPQPDPTTESDPVPAETPAPEETLAPEDEGESAFPDVPAREWYASYVAQLAAAGVVSGYDDGLFRPSNDVTWGEALKLVLLSSGFREQNPLKTKEGEEPSHWASGYLSLAEKRSYVPAGSVSDLDAPISRNALAELAAAALELETATQPDTYADSRNESALKLFAAGIMEGSFNESGQRVFKGGDRLRRSEICAVLVRVRDYVARTWILFAGYRIPINHDLAANPYDAAAYSVENGRTRYDDGTITTRCGIDVSWHQGIIDWAKVAADGVDFAMIRCGYRGSGKGELNEDTFFRDNVRGALANGIEVGVYFFSQALNENEALEELQFTLDLIKGYDITLPVVFDWEQYGSRTKSPDWSKVSDSIAAFCDGVAAAGYTPMTYYNPSLAYLHLDLPKLERFPLWLAHYVDVTDYAYDFRMWQYSSSGTVDGISGRVDMDILFTGPGR